MQPPCSEEYIKLNCLWANLENARFDKWSYSLSLPAFFKPDNQSSEKETPAGSAREKSSASDLQCAPFAKLSFLKWTVSRCHRLITKRTMFPHCHLLLLTCTPFLGYNLSKLLVSLKLREVKEGDENSMPEPGSKRGRGRGRRENARDDSRYGRSGLCRARV